MDTMYQYVETDMSKKEILELGVGAVKLKPTDIIKDVLPGQSAYLGRAWYYIMDSPVYKEQISYDVEEIIVIGQATSFMREAHWIL